MLLGAKELHSVIDSGFLDAKHEFVNAASIDIRIGDTILVEEQADGVVDIDKKENLRWREVEIPDDGIVITPGQFFLAHSMEEFNLPDNISGQFILRSSMARCGLNHLMAGWADAGFNKSKLTFEFHNVTKHHSLRVRKGMRVGQMIFSQHSPAGKDSYAVKGRYNGSEGVVASHGV
jgi:dCTP deaminase